jgi:hypothetical protein
MPVNTRGMSLEDVVAQFGRGPGYAVPRHDFDPATDSGTAGLARWMDRRRAENPNYQAPKGYEWKDDHYERDTAGVWDDILKWMAIGGAAGAGGYGTLAAMGAFGGAAGAAGAAGAGAGTGAAAAAPTIIPAATTVPLAGAAAGGTMGAMNTALGFAPYVTAGINALRRGGPTDDEQAMSQTQQQLQQMQMNRIRQSDPLYQAILQLAMGLMPMSARQGMTPQTGAQPRPRGF